MFKFLGKLFGKKAPKAKLTKNGKNVYAKTATTKTTTAKKPKVAKPVATDTPAPAAPTTDATSK